MFILRDNLRERRFHCYFDGACEPYNPQGAMGIGAVVYDKGDKIFEHSGFEDYYFANTNNVAEYKAVNCIFDFLIHEKLFDNEILVMGDSKLVINQLTKRWKIKGGMYASEARKAQEYAKQFSDIYYQWIPREINDVADELSVRELVKRGIKRTY